MTILKIYSREVFFTCNDYDVTEQPSGKHKETLCLFQNAPATAQLDCLQHQTVRQHLEAT